MADPKVELPGFGRGLSARLLALTIIFVMLSEILIYAPSIARFRLDWLEERISAGHLAILALEATPDYMIDPELELQLLNQAGALLVALRTPDGKNLVLRGGLAPPMVDATVDLSDRTFLSAVGDAFETLSQTGTRMLRIKGPSPRAPDSWIDVVVDEGPLRQAMIAFSWRILGLSVVISLITATLIFGALQWLMIRPMRRLTNAMVRFREAPDDFSHQSQASNRRDEFGVAEREFCLLRDEVIRALHQQERLASLGTAMGKINHDLRGILTTAQLVADRLTDSTDPQVRKLLPPLVRALDRASALCSDTLGFSREGPAKPELSQFPLDSLHEEVRESLAQYLDTAKVFSYDAAPDFHLVADRDHLFRVIRNLVENALQMGASDVVLLASRDNGQITIDVRDNGPGLPAKALANLFVPFKGSARSGGSGLGLATARELMRAQGGDLSLANNSASGVTFRIELPDSGDGTA